jgi:hypothetical protein
LPLKIRIASPCHARWEDMGGDDRVRFCGQCRKNVYNLSSLTAPEAAALIAAKHGRLCVRMFQRTDGTLLTEECPVGVARHWRRVKLLVAGGVTALVLALVNLRAFNREDTGDGSPGRFTAALEQGVWQVKEWLHLNPPVMGEMAVMGSPVPMPVSVMGDMAAPSRTNTPGAFMVGEVAPPPATNQPAKK